jgi:hypothetical protein
MLIICGPSNEKRGQCKEEMMFDMAFASKIRALHNCKTWSYPKMLPTGRMNDVKAYSAKNGGVRACVYLI